MSIKKTDLDIRREDIAHELTGKLLGTGISVSANGKSGPYRVTVNYLSNEKMERVVRLLVEALNERPNALNAPSPAVGSD